MEKTEALEQMTFAGGCFWCMEPPFEKLDGVRSVISGYMGGHKEMPTYKEVSSGVTGHAEVVQVTFDPKKVSLEKLLDVFWKNIDPTDANGQFVDRGEQYRSIIFYHDERQKQAAEESKRHLEAAGIFPKEIVTEIKNAGPFYPAEEYHQDYYKVNPIRYKYYRYRSGRDQFLDRVWGKRRDRKIPGMVGVQSVSLISGQADSPAAKSEGRGGLTDDHSMEKSQKFQSGVRPTKEELRKRLSPMQFRVTQEEGTEPAFKNEYWDNKRDGIYVDIVSGEPLFSSTHKYDSKTGWPSFYQPLDKQNIEEHDDSKLWMTRTEARSKAGQSHLGHVFDDGPAPTGKRYCINSAALRFIPKENLEKEGYGDYLKLFKK